MQPQQHRSRQAHCTQPKQQAQAGPAAHQQPFNDGQASLGAAVQEVAGYSKRSPALPNANAWNATAQRDGRGTLARSGCSSSQLAAPHGTAR